MLVLASLFLLTFLTPAIVGDGCVFIPTVDEWIMSYEEKQIALINYEDGMENLTIVIEMENSNLQADQAFWLFPVPGNPDNSDIDIIKNIPFYLGGYNDIRADAKEAVSNSMVMMVYSQPHLSLIPLFWYLSSGVMTGNIAYDKNLNIHQHIEKMGLTSELISAKTSDAINTYLDDKNITLSEDALNIIDEYVGNDYSFVVSWISDLETFKEEAKINIWYYEEEYYVLGVSITFPTDEIYYPLRLTSLYDEKLIPILIQVGGYVTLKNSFKNTNVNYYLYGEKEYTEISIRTESKEFTEDLWIENKEPASIQSSKFILSNLLLFSILVFMISSMLASIVSALIVYFKRKPILWKFAVIGLGNFLTIFFVFAMSFIFKMNQKFVKKPVESKRKVSRGFNLGFHITFLILGLVCLSMFLLSLLVGPFLIFILCILAMPIGILMFIYGGIKNPRVALFIGLFSLFFIVFLITISTIIQYSL